MKNTLVTLFVIYIYSTSAQRRLPGRGNKLYKTCLSFINVNLIDIIQIESALPCMTLYVGGMGRHTATPVKQDVAMSSARESVLAEATPISAPWSMLLSVGMMGLPIAIAARLGLEMYGVRTSVHVCISESDIQII